ncbi:MAG: hypothetical protein CXX81_29955 [Methanobacteriota archaeon]|nr:MAG: hypothetical protein CXX81_29955 [Euryarchaeota archaeon]
MNKAVAISGGVCLIIGLLGFIIGLNSTMGFEPQENIIHNTKTDGSTFGYDRDTLVIAVYAVGDVGCRDFEITIVDDGYDYFERDCDSSFGTLDYTYLGIANLDAVGNYEIESSGDIVLVSHDSVGGYGMVMIGGGGCCFIGVILLIVGLLIGNNKASDGQTLVLQNPADLQQVGIGMAVQQPTVQYQQQAVQQPQMANQQWIQQPNPTVPTNQPVVEPAVEHSTGSPPPIPAEGLPPGWDMQQWNHYGHDWLRQQGRV